MLYTNEPQITAGTRLQSNYDLNKANTSGWYTATSPKNGVSGLNSEKLFVIAPKNKNYITQFAFGDNDNLESMWFRSCANGTWSEWKEVATTDLYLAIAGGTITGDLTVKGNINGKFAGTPTAPNATGSSSDQQIANLKYVNDSISKLIDYSPAALDTLKELASAIGNDPNFAATMTSKLSEKFDKVGGQISGDVNVTGKIIGHLVGNADTATRAVTAATADKTQASISFKNPDGSNTSFNGNTAVDMTGGVYYAKESSHTVNADEATHAASATAVNATAPVGQTKALVSAGMAGNDIFRIQVGGSNNTGAGEGYVSFDTCDDGTEPIYFRQYTGASVAHQITLLDGNGNTSFPGTVNAPTFSGHLVGNADHATNASHADKADNALYASVANHTDNSISFKNINGSNVSFNGNTAVDLTGGVYYAKESSHTINADSAGTAGTCTGNSATATSAAKLGRDGVPGNPMTFNWSGQSGQPSWLWGGNDGTNMYVWNPSNFSVAHAVNADNAGSLSGNIQLKYETNANGNKGINAYVDGNKVQVSSPTGNVIQEKHILLELVADLEVKSHPNQGDPPSTTYWERTTGNVEALVFNKVTTYSDGPYGKFELGSDLIQIGSKVNTTLGTSFSNEGMTDSDCEQQAINYLKQHYDEFKSRIAQTIHEAAQATESYIKAVVVSSTNL